MPNEKSDELMTGLVLYFADQGKTVAADDDLFELEIIDSMGVLDLVIFLEQNYSLEIDQPMLTKDNFCSIRRIAETVSA